MFSGGHWIEFTKRLISRILGGALQVLPVPQAAPPPAHGRDPHRLLHRPTHDRAGPQVDLAVGQDPALVLRAAALEARLLRGKIYTGSVVCTTCMPRPSQTNFGSSYPSSANRGSSFGSSLGKPGAAYPGSTGSSLGGGGFVQPRPAGGSSSLGGGGFVQPKPGHRWNLMNPISMFSWWWSSLWNCNFSSSPSIIKHIASLAAGW